MNNNFICCLDWQMQTWYLGLLDWWLTKQKYRSRFVSTKCVFCSFRFIGIWLIFFSCLLFGARVLGFLGLLLKFRQIFAFCIYSTCQINASDPLLLFLDWCFFLPLFLFNSLYCCSGNIKVYVCFCFRNFFSHTVYYFIFWMPSHCTVSQIWLLLSISLRIK